VNKEADRIRCVNVRLPLASE